MVVKRIRILGIYLLVGCCLQVLLYFALSITSNCDWLCCFDARSGITFFESSQGRNQMSPSVVRWLALGWILALSVLLFAGRRLIKTYIVSEILLSLPTVAFFVLIAIASLAPGSNFSIRQLFWPALVMILFSIIPLGLAFWSRRH